jgi:chromosome segregation ATPase
MSDPDNLIEQLESKRSELVAERERLEAKIAEIDNKLGALEETIDVFREEKSEEFPLSKLRDRKVAQDKQLSDWPEEASMPEKVLHVFQAVPRIMQPGEMDEYVRENSTEDIRDNAVAETMSRLARQDRLRRKDYGASSFYYGLPDWWREEEGDFKDTVKPELA